MLLTAGRKDIKSEFRVMASALSKEMGMMETQLKRWKEAAHDALSLSEEAQSLKAQLDRKVLSHLPILFLLLLVKLFLCIMWTILSEQNTLTFEGNDHSPLELKIKFSRSMYNWIAALSVLSFSDFLDFCNFRSCLVVTQVLFACTWLRCFSKHHLKNFLL